MSSTRKPKKDKTDDDRSVERARDDARAHKREHKRGVGHDEGCAGHEPHGLRPAECAMAAVMMTARMIHRFRESRISQNKKFNKLSGPRLGVLFTIRHSGRIRMGDLAAKLHVAPRTVTDLVDGLERDGFVHRVLDPNDRRASILELSAQAKKDFDHMASMRVRFIEEIFSPLSDEEKDTLVSLLNKLCEGPIRDLIAGDYEKFGKPDN